MQRPLNTKYNIARDGSAKSAAPEAIPVAHGMKNQTKQAGPGVIRADTLLDDEPLQKAYNSTPITPNPGTPSRAYDQRGGHRPGEASAVLHDAARLGKPLPSKGSKA